MSHDLRIVLGGSTAEFDNIVELAMDFGVQSIVFVMIDTDGSQATPSLAHRAPGCRPEEPLLSERALLALVGVLATRRTRVQRRRLDGTRRDGARVISEVTQLRRSFAALGMTGR